MQNCFEMLPGQKRLARAFFMQQRQPGEQHADFLAAGFRCLAKNAVPIF
ncbi:MAG: hypothetical protein IJU79_01125 [Desulfovibrionaceae bacterium]|nr:hypothetical protein [Desulfovibrionaceae bacterium]